MKKIQWNSRKLRLDKQTIQILGRTALAGALGGGPLNRDPTTGTDDGTGAYSQATVCDACLPGG